MRITGHWKAHDLIVAVGEVVGAGVRIAVSASPKCLRIPVAVKRVGHRNPRKCR